MPVTLKTPVFLLALVLAAGMLPGCASKKSAAAPAASAGYEDEAPPATIADPIEGFNRFWFVFNDGFYTVLGTPVSKAYSTILPQYARDRINCAYQNFLFPVRFANAILQLRPDKASRELGRFIVNTTFGVGGLLDLAATKPDMKPQKLDFGQTLGYWGIGHGFYVVLPFIGPSSLRDTVGLAGDMAMQPLTYVDVPVVLTASIAVGSRLNRLPETLALYQELKRSALEPYSAARDAYAQLRAETVREAQDVLRQPKPLEKTGEQPGGTPGN